MTALDAASATLRLRGILMVACAAFCWSTGGLLQRLISADAWTTIFWRAVFAAVFLLAFVLWRDRGRGLAPFKESGWAGFAAGFCFATASTFYIVSLSLTKVANTLIVLSTSPFLTALLAWVVLGEQVRTRTWVAIAAAIGGISLMVANSAARGNLMGDLLAFVPPLMVASATVLIRRKRNVRMAPAAAVAAVLAIVFTWPLAHPTRRCRGAACPYGPRALGRARRSFRQCAHLAESPGKPGGCGGCGFVIGCQVDPRVIAVLCSA